MKYRPNEGIFGNLKRLFAEETQTQGTMWQHKADAETNHFATEDALCEVDPTQKVEDLETASLELDERLIALEEKINLLEKKNG